MTFFSYHSVDVPTRCFIIIAADSDSLLYIILSREYTKIFIYPSVDILNRIVSSCLLLQIMIL